MNSCCCSSLLFYHHQESVAHAAMPSTTSFNTKCFPKVSKCRWSLHYIIIDFGFKFPEIKLKWWGNHKNKWHIMVYSVTYDGVFLWHKRQTFSLVFEIFLCGTFKLVGVSSPPLFMLSSELDLPFWNLWNILPKIDIFCSACLWQIYSVCLAILCRAVSSSRSVIKVFHEQHSSIAIQCQPRWLVSQARPFTQ